MIDPGFTTEAMSSVFSAESRVSTMVQVESMLAATQASCGVIPQVAAADIVAELLGPVGDPDAVLADGWTLGSPVVALLDRLRARLPSESAPWLHYGATSQDIIDTAMMLQVGRANKLIVKVARSVTDRLAEHRIDFGDAASVTRTLMQPAEPHTFAYRIDRWRDPLLNRIAALEAQQRFLQLGGASGDRQVDDVAKQMAAELGLCTRTTWHTDREPIVAMVFRVNQLVQWAAKIAGDLIVLGQPELGEVSIRAGGSTAMAHKRNPIDAIRARAAAAANDGVASIVLRSPTHEFERAAGAWQAEWFAVPLVYQTAAASLYALDAAVQSLTVPPGRRRD